MKSKPKLKPRPENLDPLVYYSENIQSGRGDRRDDQLVWVGKYYGKWTVSVDIARKPPTDTFALKPEYDKQAKLLLLEGGPEQIGEYKATGRGTKNRFRYNGKTYDSFAEMILAKRAFRTCFEATYKDKEAAISVANKLAANLPDWIYRQDGLIMSLTTVSR